MKVTWDKIGEILITRLTEKIGWVTIGWVHEGTRAKVQCILINTVVIMAESVIRLNQLGTMYVINNKKEFTHSFNESTLIAFLHCGRGSDSARGRRTVTWTFDTLHYTSKLYVLVWLQCKKKSSIRYRDIS